MITNMDTRLELLDPYLMDNNAWNPNMMEDAEFLRLVREIEDVGFIDPVQVVPVEGGRYRIIGGEHRVAAALKLQLDRIPAIILDGPRWKDTDLQKLVTVRLNVLKGNLNPDRMARLYNEMAKKYGEDALQSLFTFTDRHGWNKLVDQIRRGLSKTGLPKEKQKQFSDRAKEARTLTDLERILNELWSSYGDTVQHSFIIFTFGRQEHTYVSLNQRTHRALRKITNYCKDQSKDINSVLGPAIQALAGILAKKEKKKEKSKLVQDDIGF